MKRSNLYYGILVVALGVLALIPIEKPSAFSISDEKDPFFLTIPTQLGDWKGVEDPVGEDVFEILETRNVLSRVYHDSKGNRVHFFLVSSKKDRRVAHPPEVCYLSSNYEILNRATGKLDWSNDQGYIDVNHFLARNEKNHSRKEEVMYVYKIGDRFTTNYYAQQLEFALNRLTRKESKVLLIRFSSPNTEALTQFVKAVSPHLE